jgi:hypothetical protein
MYGMFISQYGADSVHDKRRLTDALEICKTLTDNDHGLNNSAW